MSGAAGAQPLKGLLFDKDGTLLEFQATWGRWAAGLVASLAADEPSQAGALASALGVDLTKGMILPGSVIIAGTPTDIAEAVAAHFPTRSAEKLSAEILHLSQKVVPVPVCDLVSLFDEFASMGLQLGVATNDGQSLAQSQVSALCVDHYFGFVAGFDSGFGVKPGPGMCNAFLGATGLDPQQAAMVGDSLHDLEAGRAAGMVCVAVETGLATAEELAHAADVVLPDIAHLPSWLAARA